MASNHEGLGKQIFRRSLGTLAVLGACQVMYNLGNYNDVPGSFVDTHAVTSLHPQDAFAAPWGDLKWTEKNIGTVISTVANVRNILP